jgi:hypothetical protein
MHYVFFPADRGELDTIEEAIIEESLRVAELEEATLREESDIERSERRHAWSMIEKLPNEGGVMLMAIQAEMDRTSNQFKQASERRAQRAAQRQAAREEVARYRRQRHTSAILRLVSYTATAVFAIYSVRSLLGGVSSTANRVVRGTNDGGRQDTRRSTGNNGSSSSSASSAGNASSSSCRKRWWD